MRTPTNERVNPVIADPAKAHASEPAETCLNHAGPNQTGPNQTGLVHGEEAASRPPKPTRKAKAEPERRCVISGETCPQAQLIRLALSPDGDVLPDIFGKAPGRGAWIGVNRTELESALANGKLRGGLARAFKQNSMTIPADLPEQIAQGLKKALLDRLGLELRIGSLILGSQKIADNTRAGKTQLVCHASDASEGGMSKLDQAWRVGTDQEGSGLRGMRLPLDRETLSVALGRENVVHFAIRDAASVDRVRASLDRLQHFSAAENADKTDMGQADIGQADKGQASPD